jgi:hypothetical protein
MAKKTHILWFKLLMSLVIIIVIGFHFSEIGKVEKFSGVFAVAAAADNAINEGQMTVLGMNNRLHKSWLPHQNGNVYIRPNTNKDIHVGDENTQNITIGASSNISSIRFGKDTWLPFTDGNMLIRPNKENGSINIGDKNTKSVSLGGNAAISSVNVGPRSWFPHSDGNTYIRSGKDQREVIIGDDNWTKRVILGGEKTPTVIRGRLDFKDQGNNSDSYHLEKIIDGKNKSHLRLTLKDDADESLQIWGDSCGQGSCGGPGRKVHHFAANGNAIHAGSICIDDVCVNKAQLKKVQRL